MILLNEMLIGGDIMTRRYFSLLLIITLLAPGCTGYKSQYVSFRPPEAYPNKLIVDGISIGGEGYSDRDVGKEAFGFDIIEVGLLPVQLVFDNRSNNTLSIVTNQTFLVDAKGGYWQVVPNQIAVDRIEKSTQFAALGKGAGTGAVVGAVGGAILGAAIGIVSGRNVGGSLGKGAALGAAGGAIVGTAKESSSTDRQASIVSDIRNKGLEGKMIPKEHLANGFIFFPAEAKTAKAIIIQFKEIETGKIIKVTLNL
jgi:hypothetical protein